MSLFSKECVVVVITQTRIDFRGSVKNSRIVRTIAEKKAVVHNWLIRSFFHPSTEHSQKYCEISIVVSVKKKK